MPRPITVSDLPRLVSTTYMRPDGSTYMVEPRRPFLACTACHGRYSADPGDYWWMPRDQPMRCCGRLLRLVVEERRLVEV